MKKNIKVLGMLGLVMSLSAIGCGKGGGPVKGLGKNTEALKGSCLSLEKLNDRLKAIPADQGVSRTVSLETEAEASPAYMARLAREYVVNAPALTAASWVENASTRQQEGCERLIDKGDILAIHSSSPTSLSFRKLESGVLESSGVYSIDGTSVETAQMAQESLTSPYVAFEVCNAEGKVEVEVHYVTQVRAVMLDGSPVADSLVDPKLTQLLDEVQKRGDAPLSANCPKE